MPTMEHSETDDAVDEDHAFDADGEASYACWACGEEIVVPIDPTMERRDYVEDCPVCCRPGDYELDPEDGHVRCWNSPVG